LLRADGSSGGLVYGRGDEVGFGPRWSPDGTRLAFFDPVRSAIIVFNFTPDRLSVPIQTAVAFDWSPDGKALAVEDIVVEGSAFQHVVQLADVETGNLRRITERGAIDESAPAWSPEGGRLAFTQRGTVGQIDGAQPMVRDLATMAVAPVLPSGDRTRDRMIETSSIVWSSDGQRLLLGRSTLGDPGAKPEVWLVALGGEARRLGEGDAPRWLP
jgi:Tol biopolymer transport system component